MKKYLFVSLLSVFVVGLTSILLMRFYWPAPKERPEVVLENLGVEFSRNEDGFLEILDVDGALSSFHEIIDIQEIQKIELRGSSISDFSQINNLNAQELHLLIYDHKCELDFEGLKSSEIRKVEIFGCELTENAIANLANCENLEAIQLANCECSYQGIGELKSLRKLTIFAQHGSAHLSEIKNLGRLEKLDLHFKTQVRVDLDLPNSLRILSLKNVYSINSKLNPFALPNLQDLMISSSDFAEIDILFEPSQLMTLKIYRSPVSSFESSFNFPKLMRLELGHTRISKLDLSREKQFPILSTVSVYGSPIKSISGAESVGRLDVGYTKITDWNFLGSFPNLYSLEIEGLVLDEITNESSPFESMKQLRQLNVSRQNNTQIIEQIRVHFPKIQMEITEKKN